jgi:hypothetical protein
VPRTLRFQAPAENRRPYGCHRFDAWSPKLGRRLMLFGEWALSAWIAIEADANVVGFCERPMVIGSQKPPRVVDFWIKRIVSEELWLLLREKEQMQQAQGETLVPAFRSWVQDAGLTVRFLRPEEFALGEQLRRNWSTVLHYLAANQALLRQELIDRLRGECRGGAQLEALEKRFAPEDPILVRTAIFCLLHQGAVRASEFESDPIGPSMRFEAV